MINDRAALRVADGGVHAACCGANTWIAIGGAPAVTINNRGAHRKGDPCLHCGGIGALVDGSPDVFIGDAVEGGEHVGWAMTMPESTPLG
jgi:uncharacterized Zn-binding protein involved in type VI secretion